MTTALLVFDTTHHALWAEEVAGRHGLAVDVVPAPSQADAKCDLALASLPEQLERLCGALDEEGVPYRVFRSGSAG